jgi:hypothetical protein
MLLLLTLLAAACDTGPQSDPLDTNRAAEAEIVQLEAGSVGESTAVLLDGETEGSILWTVHPPDRGAVACLAGVGRKGFLAPSVPGVYVVRASMVEPETLEVMHTVETEVFVEGRDAQDGCLAGAIPDGVLPSADELSGIDPTPFNDEVSGIDPTPFYEAVAGIDPTPFHEDVAGVEPTPFLASLFPDGASVSAGCLCASE